MELIGVKVTAGAEEDIMLSDPTEPVALQRTTYEEYCMRDVQPPHVIGRYYKPVDAANRKEWRKMLSTKRGAPDAWKGKYR